jgi:hypothetical protein
VFLAFFVFGIFLAFFVFCIFLFFLRKGAAPSTTPLTKCPYVKNLRLREGSTLNEVVARTGQLSSVFVDVSLITFAFLWVIAYRETCPYLVNQFVELSFGIFLVFWRFGFWHFYTLPGASLFMGNFPQKCKSD